uniref:OsmC family peroxiredoxin n=1 Tax=Escherichia coli TaxID=562 RepID=UPI00069BE75B
ADRNRSHWSTSKTPSYTKSVSWQHHHPEELIGAAHAACFSMALSLMLGEAGFTPTSIDTTADVSLDKVDAGFAITKIALKSEVAVPGIDASTFDGIIQKAKAGCPVSQVLKAEITLDYQLKS